VLSGRRLWCLSRRLWRACVRGLAGCARGQLVGLPCTESFAGVAQSAEQPSCKPPSKLALIWAAILVGRKVRHVFGREPQEGLGSLNPRPLRPEANAVQLVKVTGAGDSRRGQLSPDLSFTSWQSPTGWTVCALLVAATVVHLRPLPSGASAALLAARPSRRFYRPLPVGLAYSA
jgi:hypothetical protein